MTYFAATLVAPFPFAAAFLPSEVLAAFSALASDPLLSITNGVYISTAIAIFIIASTNPHGDADESSPPNPTGIVQGIKAIDFGTSPKGPIKNHVVNTRIGCTKNSGIANVALSTRG